MESLASDKLLDVSDKGKSIIAKYRARKRGLDEKIEDGYVDTPLPQKN